MRWCRPTSRFCDVDHPFVTVEHPWCAPGKSEPASARRNPGTYVLASEDARRKLTQGDRCCPAGRSEQVVFRFRAPAAQAATCSSGATAPYSVGQDTATRPAPARARRGTEANSSSSLGGSTVRQAAGARRNSRIGRGTLPLPGWVATSTARPRLWGLARSPRSPDPRRERPSSGRPRPFRRTAYHVDFAPVRVIELVDLEATVQRGGSGLVHRFPCQQCRHRRHLLRRAEIRLLLVSRSSSGEKLLLGRSPARGPRRRLAVPVTLVHDARPELPRIGPACQPVPTIDTVSSPGRIAAAIERRQRGRAPGRW